MVDDVEHRHDLADPESDVRQRRSWGLVGSAPFELKKDEGHRDEDGVMRPTAMTAAFEMVETEFVLELAILLLDRPPTAGERDQVVQRGRRVEVEQVVFPFVVHQRALAQEPPL